MASNLSIAFQITGIGMGLVFGCIILLWILIAIIVRVATNKIEPSSKSIVSISVQGDLKTKIAIAAATAAVLEDRNATPNEFPLPATALVSAWQAVMRTDMLKKRGKTR